MGYVWFRVTAGAAVGALVGTGRLKGRSSLVGGICGGVIIGAVAAGCLFGVSLEPGYHGWIGNTVAATGAIVLLSLARASRRGSVPAGSTQATRK